MHFPTIRVSYNPYGVGFDHNIIRLRVCLELVLTPLFYPHALFLSRLHHIARIVTAMYDQVAPQYLDLEVHEYASFVALVSVLASSVSNHCFLSLM